MFARLTVLLAFASVTTLAQSPVEPVKVTNSLGTESGQKVHFVQKDDSDTQVNGQLVEKTSESREFTLTFGDKREDGTTPAAMRYTRIYGWAEDGEGNRVEYDSLSEEEVTFEPALIRMRMLAGDMQTRFDAQGKLIEFSGMDRLLFGEAMAPQMELDDGALGGFGMVFCGFPAAGVATGESWTEPVSFQIMGMKMKGKTERTLRGARDDGRYVSSTGLYDVDVSGMAELSGVKPSKMKMTGSLRFDPATGLPDRAETTQNMDLVMPIEGTDETATIAVESKLSITTMALPTVEARKKKADEDAADGEKEK